jgi:hypothetical protein
LSKIKEKSGDKNFESESDETFVKVRDILEQVCYDKLEASHGGWEINGGSYGTFNFDVLNRKVNLEFNERIEEVNSSEESF